MTLNIGIVGAGICGLALGRLLKKQGHFVTLFEQQETNVGGGAGIVIAQNGMLVMRQLGLEKEVQNAGAIVAHAGLKTCNGESLSKVNLKRVGTDFNLSSVAIKRSHLHQILGDGLESHVHKSMVVSSVKESSERVTLEFKNGETREFDYVIGADGLHSTVRVALLGTEQVRDSGTHCWRGIVSRATVHARLNLVEEFYEYWGQGSRFGYCALNEDDIYWFAVVSSKALQNNRPWQEWFSSYVEGIPELISATPSSSIIERQILDRAPANLWHSERIVLCGDAIHPTTPNMGQGACMALESALVLAKEIQMHGFSSTAFASYQRKRTARTQMVTNTSHRIGQIAHWSHPLAVRFRNLITRMSPAPERQLKKFLHVDFGV